MRRLLHDRPNATRPDCFDSAIHRRTAHVPADVTVTSQAREHPADARCCRSSRRSSTLPCSSGRVTHVRYLGRGVRAVRTHRPRFNIRLVSWRPTVAPCPMRSGLRVARRRARPGRGPLVLSPRVAVLMRKPLTSRVALFVCVRSRSSTPEHAAIAARNSLSPGDRDPAPAPASASCSSSGTSRSPSPSASLPG